MNRNLRELLSRAIGAVQDPGSLVGDDSENLVQDLMDAIAEDGSPDSVVYPLTIKVVGITEVAILLGCSAQNLLDPVDNSNYCYGTNDRTLVSRDNFREYILEMALDEHEQGYMETLHKFNSSIDANTYIDLEA